MRLHLSQHCGYCIDVRIFTFMFVHIQVHAPFHLHLYTAMLEILGPAAPGISILVSDVITCSTLIPKDIPRKLRLHKIQRSTPATSTTASNDGRVYSNGGRVYRNPTVMVAGGTHSSESNPLERGTWWAPALPLEVGPRWGGNRSPWYTLTINEPKDRKSTWFR